MDKVHGGSVDVTKDCLRILKRAASQGSLYCSQKIAVFFKCGYVWIVGDDLRSGSEQESGLASTDHAEVIETVAGSDRLVTDGLKRFDGCKLAVFAAHFISGDLAAW